jgi:putative FmdB family regulatory protein
MPIYEFKCAKCGREFEELILGSKEKPACPACGHKKCDKLLSSFRFGASGRGGDLSASGSGGGGSSCGSCAATSCAGCGSR